jgi:nitrate/nitrite-specific signal transduction histidine kinase
VSLSSDRTDDPGIGASRDAVALDANLAIARLLAAETDLETILDLVARRGRALVSARTVVIELREGNEMAVAAVAGGISEGLAAEARLVVPLSLGGRSYGALVASGSEFSIEDEETLETLAANAAAAVATAKSFDLAGRREQLAASESERARWARELQAIADLQVEGGKLRSLITELRPPVLDELGVGAAIEALADQVESPSVEVQTRIELAFERGRIQVRHDGELETAVYRIVQEALANAVAHAQASRVAIEVTEDGNGVRVAVHDDGSGFDPAAASSGFGLKRMRERAELLGGSLEIDSWAGEGTEVRAAIPSLGPSGSGAAPRQASAP